MPEQENKKPFSGSISLVRVADGESAGSYFVESNVDNILRFETSNGVEISPATISFKVIDFVIEEYKKDFDWSLSYLSEGKFKEIANKNTPNFETFAGFTQDFLTDAQSIAENETDSNLKDTLYFRLDAFFRQLPIDLQEIKGLINQGIFTLKFSYLEENKVKIEKIFNTQNGVSADMAKLNIEATKITAIVDKVNLELNANGLALKNGDFMLYDNENSPVLFMDNNTGNLVMKGDIYANNGYFKGEVHATNGTFAGEIQAEGGSIGGFEIKDGELVSSNGSLRLQGAAGKIIAQDIELGVGAVISKFISFPYQKEDSTTSSAFIHNPNLEENKGLWLEAGGVKLYTDGTLELGAIKMYGGDETQQAYLTSPQYNSNGLKADGKWRINQDGSAYFDVIDINHANIHESVLKIGTVQSVGSLMLFKDSWTVVSVDGENPSKVFLDSQPNLKIDDWVYDGNQIYQVKEFSTEGNWIILNRAFTSERFILTKFGSSSNDYILSIFGESSSIAENNSRPFASGNSLTLSTFEFEKGATLATQGKYQNRLILGDLSSSNIQEVSAIGGVGLYADNVYLNGALVTRTSSEEEPGCYAGINTDSKSIFMNGTDENDKSNIVIWAGAIYAQNENGLVADLSSSPFQVSRNGSLYAKQAIIEDSVIAGANLYGSKIYTAELHGWNYNENSTSELSIYNSSKGIVFRREPEGNETLGIELFRISERGLSTGTGEDFVSIINQKANFFGSFTTNQKENLEGKIYINGQEISYIVSDNTVPFSIQLEQENKEYNLIIKSNFGKETEQNEITIQPSFTTIQNNFNLGGKLDYKKILNGSEVIGYDLYIY